MRFVAVVEWHRWGPDRQPCHVMGVSRGNRYVSSLLDAELNFVVPSRVPGHPAEGSSSSA